MTASPHIPDNICLYAIGDIHGRMDLLRQLLDMIVLDAAQHGDKDKRIVFLGDYIDRGPDSRGVIDLLLHDLPKDFTPVFLRGNHEAVLLDILAGDTGLVLSWLQFGGEETSTSYGVNSLRPALTQDLLRQELLHAIPAAHRQFLESTLYSYVCGDYYFAHAGVRPGVPLDKQDPKDLMWIRKEFLTSPENFGKIVIHGHSITKTPAIHPNRIGIDTGAYASGHLTCLKLLDKSQRFIST